jgi:dimethylglycine dehydrogenase
MLKPEYAAVGTKLKIRILGTLYDAEVVEESPFDTENALLRA